MVEPEGFVVTVLLTDTEAPLTSLLINEMKATEPSGKIKSDWWSLRADLRPMSEYGMGKREA